jgi:alpha-acetolactate decarboxylase
MVEVRMVIINLFACLFFVLSMGCSLQNGGNTSITANEGYIAVFNRVDELLMGDLQDTVSLKELERKYTGEKIIGLGTTSLEHCGELMFMSGACYWADPTKQGRIMELDWTEEMLPFCAIVIIDEGEKQVFDDVNGDIHQWLENVIAELDIPLAAVEVKGKFDGVRLSVADKLPSNPEETVRSVIIAVDEKQEWEFVGFYAFAENDQELISVVGHPVHLHGKMMDGSIGGHLQKADALDAEVTIYPVNQYILRNRVPGL